jgi:hypothetical protein
MKVGRACCGVRSLHDLEVKDEETVSTERQPPPPRQDCDRDFPKLMASTQPFVIARCQLGVMFISMMISSNYTSATIHAHLYHLHLAIDCS